MASDTPVPDPFPELPPKAMITPVLASDERGDNATKVKSLKVQNNKAGLGPRPSTHKNKENNNELVYLHITKVLLDGNNNTQISIAIRESAPTLPMLLDYIRTPASIIGLRWKDKDNGNKKKMLTDRGCIHAPLYDDQGNVLDNQKCLFCRSPHPKTDEEICLRHEKRMEAGDTRAIYARGNQYRDGRNGFPQDYAKALELWHKAGELGYATAFNSIGVAYTFGEGVEVDEKRGRHYWELAAMGGDMHVRHNLGLFEEQDGNNIERALKHWMIAVRNGYSNSLKRIKELYKEGNVTKDDYAKALQAYQKYLNEIKSDQRDKVASFSDDYKYY